ncbi:zinc-binding dehydrogenase [Solihabitans fulvus]|uniref:Zinc-binding dehydrogenase n=1 Tax=Solihabitans fulvus TaxID=1892852 RepID=A0A5B2XVL6_9PSEU|nr:zinc-binding dehydrogenase [Solihabitans fulvus]KAA2267030.1 zinc-binding dehydrogenase [Solihabitans fulvus]
MRIVRYHQHGGPEVLRIEEADTPSPGPGEVLIRTEAVGVNYVETLRRGATLRASGAASTATTRALHSGLPGAPSGDVVGPVVAVGDGVTGVRVGDRVATVVRDGAYADHGIAQARWLVPVPAGMDAAEATILASPAQVALGVLRTGRLAEGETVLVHSAAGAIGHLLVQLARALGAGRIIATASSPEKLDFARSFGADVAIDYRSDAWADEVASAAGGRGVDVVADSIGGEVLRAGLRLLAPYGRLVVYGAMGDLTEPAASPMDVFGMKSLTGFAFSELRQHRPDLVDDGIREVLGHVAAGRLRAAVHARLPLADAAEAHRILESRTQLGRVVLVP